MEFTGSEKLFYLREVLIYESDPDDRWGYENLKRV